MTGPRTSSNYPYRALAARVVGQAMCDYLGVGLALGGGQGIPEKASALKKEAHIWFHEGELGGCQYFLDCLGINVSASEALRRMIETTEGMSEEEKVAFISVFIK